MELLVLIAKVVLIALALGVVAFVFIQHRRGIAQLEADGHEPVREPEPKRPPRSWQTKLDGHKAFVIKAEIEVGRIALAGWDARCYQWREGDWLELFTPSGALSTRYRINKLVLAHGMYTAECRFAPRDAKALAESIVGRLGS